MQLKQSIGSRIVRVHVTCLPCCVSMRLHMLSHAIPLVHEAFRTLAYHNYSTHSTSQAAREHTTVSAPSITSAKSKSTKVRDATQAVHLRRATTVSANNGHPRSRKSRSEATRLLVLCLVLLSFTSLAGLAVMFLQFMRRETPCANGLHRKISACCGALIFSDSCSTPLTRRINVWYAPPTAAPLELRHLSQHRPGRVDLSTHNQKVFLVARDIV